ncbi:MAG: peptidylprolyl isomerase [Planctomycetota bacterium]
MSIARCRSTLTAVIALVAILTAFTPARAQLAPAKLYNGSDRPFELVADVPAGSEATVRIYAPGDVDGSSLIGDVLAETAVTNGSNDLAEAIEDFWILVNRPSTYAQLVIDGEPTGSPVVLQPMLSPIQAQLQQDRAVFRPRGRRIFSGIRAYVEKLVAVDTTAGEMQIRLRPEFAPNTVFNFRSLVDGGYYTDIIFHRILGPSERGPGFVIQVGDPTGAGSGGPGYFVDLEQTPLLHDFGVVSMARTGFPDTNGSQIFICLSREQTQGLDTQYTAFAEVVAGAQPIMDIATVDVNSSGRPLGQPPMINSARLIDAPPVTQRRARVERPSSER